MSIQIYENALDQARNDLDWITREFEKLRIRKELLESSVGALTPLIQNLKSQDEHGSTSHHGESHDHQGHEEHAHQG